MQAVTARDRQRSFAYTTNIQLEQARSWQTGARSSGRIDAEALRRNGRLPRAQRARDDVSLAFKTRKIQGLGT